MEKTEYTEYVEHFERVFQAYQNVEQYLELSDNFKSYLSDKQTWIDRLKSPEFPVAFIGSFSAGKSMVINAILGRNILPEAAKSFTAIPTHVKKGNRDYAVIHYLGETEKKELRNLYILEIASALGKGDQYILDLVNLNDQDLLSRLQQNITEVVQFSSTPFFSQSKLFDELKMLIAKSVNFNGQKKEINLSEIATYVTENSENKDVLFIDRVEVFLTETNIPEEGVVLLDLPSLGVVNPRHKEITKLYVAKEAKAFVVTTTVLKLLEGEEIELLDEIHQQRPEVLQRAFWVINQWDTAGEQQRKESSTHFDTKVREHQFNVKRERVFKVTALLYLLLKLIEEDQLKGSGLEKYIDVLEKFVGEVPRSREKARDLINSIQEIQDFVQMKEALLAYLSNTAKKEFLEEAKKACRELSTRLLDQLKPLYRKPHEDEESFKNFLIRRETDKRTAKILSDLEEIVSQKIREGVIRTVISQNFVLWTEDKQRGFEAELTEAVKILNRQELKDELVKGPDITRNLSRLPQKLEEKLPISKMFRDHLQSLMQENVVETFSLKLLDDLKDSSSMPDEVLDLNDKLGDRDLLARIKGHCDVLLFNYGDTIESLGAEMAQHSFSENKTLDEIIELALNLYEKKMIDFIQGQQATINEYTKRGIKNYFEELDKALLELFREKRFDINEEIRRRVTSNIDDELGFELKKQNAINDAYQTLTDVKTICQ
jgi:cell fate (sporulation/competence/biofilm development) regulator YlbF (YheA/YmcA/DUF963 family)